MKASKPLIILASTGALVGVAGGAALAQQRATIDADADVLGARVAFEATTPQATTRVTFLYGGKRIKGRLTETDREDRTKDWDAATRALRSDRRLGSVVKYRVRACNRSGCTTSRFQERVSWDD